MTPGSGSGIRDPENPGSRGQKGTGSRPEPVVLPFFSPPPPPPPPGKLDPQHTGRIRKRGNCWWVRGSVADPKQKFRIRSRIRLRPEVSFGFGFESGSKSGFGSISKRHGSADQDPYQTIKDPQPCAQLPVNVFYCTAIVDTT